MKNTLLSKNYFELFGLPLQFDVDFDALNTAYHALQKELHPDRFAASTEGERLQSVQATAYVNEAFDSLKDPAQRGRYLLNLAGHPIDDKDTRMDPLFLMEQLEIREQLAQAKNQDDPFGALDDIEKKRKNWHQSLLAELSEQLTEKNYPAAQESVRKLQFLDKLKQDMELEEERLAEML